MSSAESKTDQKPLPPTYAIADLHGRHDLLVAALDGIERHAGTRPARIVTLGDYIDRGPESRQVVETLMAGPRRSGDELICLKGNHESMMSSCLRRRDPISWWLDNGGDATLISYGQNPREPARPEIVPPEHLAWIERLPLMWCDPHRVFVHAGLDEALSLSNQIERTLVWRRYPPNWTLGFGSLHIVHGHEPYPNGPLLHPGRTDLDTLAWRTGRLVVGVFDAGIAGGPVELIEVRL